MKIYNTNRKIYNINRKLYNINGVLYNTHRKLYNTNKIIYNINRKDQILQRLTCHIWLNIMGENSNQPTKGKY